MKCSRLGRDGSPNRAMRVMRPLARSDRVCRFAFADDQHVRKWRTHVDEKYGRCTWRTANSCIMSTIAGCLFAADQRGQTLCAPYKFHFLGHHRLRSYIPRSHSSFLPFKHSSCPLLCKFTLLSPRVSAPSRFSAHLYPPRPKPCSLLSPSAM